MSALPSELDRLTRLLDGLGFDFEASYRPGLTVDEIQRVLDSYLTLPPGVAFPDEVFEWHGWQNGSRWEEGYEDTKRVQTIAPTIQPVSLALTIEAFQAHEPHRLASDIVIPLFAGSGTGEVYAYRLAASHTWHLSVADSKEMFWTSPEDLESTGPNSQYLIRNWLSLTEWVAELNSAIDDGRLVRGGHNEIVPAVDYVDCRAYPWRVGP